MRDFLETLIARSLGAADAIQPRLPSRFEPLAADRWAAGREPGIATEDADPAATPLSAPIVERAPMASPRLIHRPVQLDDGVSAARAWRLAPPREPHESVVSPAFVDSAGGDHRREDRMTTQASIADARVVHRSVDEGALLPRERPTSPSPSPAPPPTAIRRWPRQVVEPPAPRERVAIRTTLFRERLREEPAYRSSTTLVVGPAELEAPRARSDGAPHATFGVATDRLSRRRVDAPAMPAQVARTDSPDIHVTIGRVEVRAAAPSTPADARRGAPQAMSLDEYLRRRSSRG